MLHYKDLIETQSTLRATGTSRALAIAAKIEADIRGIPAEMKMLRSRTATGNIYFKTAREIRSDLEMLYRAGYFRPRDLVVICTHLEVLRDMIPTMLGTERPSRSWSRSISTPYECDLAVILPEQSQTLRGTSPRLLYMCTGMD